jgi:hypothetical protein
LDIDIQDLILLNLFMFPLRECTLILRWDKTLVSPGYELGRGGLWGGKTIQNLSTRVETLLLFLSLGRLWREWYLLLGIVEEADEATIKASLLL